VELLQRRAEQRGADRAFVFLDGDELTLSYAQLDSAARRVAAAVSASGAAGRPVLLLYPPGRAYVEGFLGCLYAGAIAVPAYPPDPARLARTLPRLRALVADCGAKLALSVSGLVEAVPSLVAEAPELGAVDWIATDALPGDPSWDPSWAPPRAGADSLALLQYTSGSTGTPKGVLLSHANLLHNAELVRIGFGTSPDEIGMSWLPPYHDMGLIGGILQPIYAGMATVLMSPIAFLQRPMAWLEAISRFGATMSGGPNFAFDLCVRKSTPDQRAALDLSAWALAFCGAEPVRAATLDRFAAAFEPAGFRREAFYPCYGLAEATLIVTGGRPRLIRHGAAVHVSAGAPLGDQRVAVVDPSARTACTPGEVGEIWVSGGSVARGYWNRPAETEETFHARRADDPDGHYLRTGDLGFLDASGELVVTGRTKDLIIIRGRNVYPQDLEHAVEQRVPEVRAGCSAAFAVEVSGEERVAVACEVSGGEPPSVVAEIRRVLAEAAEVSPAAVVLLRPRTIPKTSSGKIQRHACQRAFAEGEWAAGGGDVVARWDQPDAGAGGGAGVVGAASLCSESRMATTERPAQTAFRPLGGRSRPALGAKGAAEPTDLVGRVAAALGIGAHEVDPGAPLTSLGLDSLRAVELRHALDEQLGLDVSVSELLAGVTVAELAARAELAAERAAADGGGDSAVAAEDRGVSDGQRALWFVQRWAPESTAYQITNAARIRSELDVDALERAFRALVRRHEALRTRLPSERGEPVRRLFDWDGSVLHRHDVAALDDHALRELVQRDARRRFDLERGPLFHVSLYTSGPSDHVLLLSVHHLVSDFWSLSVLVDDLLALYGAELTDAPAQLPELPARQAAAGRDVDRRLEYWRKTMAGAPTALELPTDYPRPRLQSFRGAAHDFRIDPQTLGRLDALARQAGVTRFVALLAGFAALLARYTGEDLVIGAPTSGREDRSSARQLGYFVNPLPLRIHVRPGTSFRALVGQVRATVLEALDNVVPFGRLVEAVRPARDPSRSPLMQAMLTLQQPPPGRPDLAAFAVGDETARVRLGGLDVEPYRLIDEGAAFDVSLMLAEVAGGLSGSMEYCADLFDEPTVARLARQFSTLLARAAADPDRPVDVLELLDEADRAAVLALADGGPAGATEPAALNEIVAWHAARRPDAAAVVSGDHVLSFAGLDRRVDRLAALLRGTLGVRRGDVVGVHLPRHVDAVVAFWAVLRAGGAYLPLEPDLPPRRLEWMISDARPVALLTHRTVADRLPDGGPRRLYLDEPMDGHLGVPRAGEEVGPDDLAYVIYTSGSTGRPKGVLVSHRGSCNVARAEGAALGLTERDRVLQYASCAYDVSVGETIDAHLAGAALVVTPPAATVPGPELVRLLVEQRITMFSMSPSVLSALPQPRLPDPALSNPELPDLTRLLVGGEACPAELVTRWAPGRVFLNGYGPTETTVAVTVARCRPDGTRPSIGRPIPGVRTYVLDDRMQPVAVGVPGELYIGGVGVALGYLGRPGLTAERFLPDPFGHPFGHSPGGRLYRTGDRVRWLPNGSLDFLGRFDDQVQVRGMRVEPGEVEARLRELFALREVAVVARPGPGGIELVAYVVAPDGPRHSVAELRAVLRAELPEPWVPGAFVYLDALPLTTSHKLDHQALPPPTPADRGVSARLAPRTELERTVAQVWASVLGVAEVGVRDHFFDELGGSSLLVAKVTSELGDRLGVEVPVTHLFEHPTVEALARRLGRDNRAGDERAGAGATSDGAAGDDRLGGGAAGTGPEDHAAARRQALARRARAGARRGTGA